MTELRYIYFSIFDYVSLKNMLQLITSESYKYVKKDDRNILKREKN